LKKKRNVISIVLLAAVAVAVSAKPAFSIFEAQYTYGLGATSASTGGSAAGSYYDTLDYLANPALVNQIGINRCTFSLGNYGANQSDEDEMKYYLFSCARRKKSYSYLSGDEAGMHRDEVIFTLGKQFKNYSTGINFSAFKFSTPAWIDFIGTPHGGNDGSAFSIDFGVYKEFQNGLKIGMVLQNLIGTVSDVQNRYGREVTVPKTLNIGATYPIQKRLNLSLGFKSIQFDAPLTSTESTIRDSIFYLGFEYLLDPNHLSTRVGYMQEAVVSHPDRDRSITFGNQYRSKSYDVSLTTYNYLDTYKRPLALTLSYMTEPGNWREPIQTAKSQEPTVQQTETEQKPAFEAPLPKVQPEPAPAIKKATEITPPPEEKETPAPDKPTTVADFKVDPKIILVPSLSSPEFSDMEDHWSKPFVASLASDGLYPKKDRENFEPGAIAPREEFCRLLFLTQLSTLFSDPVTVYFKTPYSVSAQAYLQSPKLEDAVLILEGTYDRSGPKRLVINRSALETAEVGAGQYKLRITLKNKDLLPQDLEDYITVLDTSMDFSSIASLPPEERKKQITSLKTNLATLGLNLDYLDGLMESGGMRRIDALRALFSATGIKLPDTIDKTDLFTDISPIAEEEQSIVFLASRGMRSLAGRPLMDGYPDHTFRPQREMTNAELAALIARFRQLKPDDFEPPYLAPVRPEPIAPTTTQNVPPVKVPPTGQLISELPVTHGKTTVTQPVPQPISYYIVSGTYLDKANADNEVKRLMELGYKPLVIIENMDGILMYHTAVSEYTSLSAARNAISYVNTDHYIPKIISTVGFGAAPTTPIHGAAPGGKTTGKPASAQSKSSNTDGDLRLAGESYIPNNLVHDVGDLDRYSVDNTKNMGY
jgi:hypothetical protein